MTWAGAGHRGRISGLETKIAPKVRDRLAQAEGAIAEWLSENATHDEALAVCLGDGGTWRRLCARIPRGLLTDYDRAIVFLQGAGMPAGIDSVMGASVGALAGMLTVEELSEAYTRAAERAGYVVEPAV